MSKQLRVYREGAKTEFDYQILWEEDFTKLADAVKKLELSCGKICIVADDTVGNLYGKEVQKALEELDVTVDLYTFPAGEASKNLDTVKELYAFLIEHHYTRKDVLAALGGGVTGDLTGYAGGPGRWRDGRSDGIYGGDLSAGRRLYPDSNDSSGSGRQQCRWKNRCGFYTV